MNMLPEADADVDFCYACNKETVWDGEVCNGCGREWGYSEVRTA